MIRSTLGYILAGAISATVALPALADPTIGVGLSFVFDKGPAVGIKVFGDDREEEATGYVGLDYLFNERAIRPNLGIAYMGTDWFVGADIGFIPGQQQPNFGIGAGFVDTEAVTTGAGGGGGGPLLANIAQ